MSEYQKCPICKNWGRTNTHKCPPAYGVRLEDWGPEEEVEVHAISPEEAATMFMGAKFADLDYPRSATVIVNDWRANYFAGQLYTYEIEVRAEPVFYATLVANKPVEEEREEEE